METACKILIIAGSDSGGGAGIQADIKTASALGVYAATAITAVTAQNTVGVQAVAALPPDMITAQIHSVLSDIDIDAIKIGMLADAPLIRAVADAIGPFGGPVVLDPVMVAKSGAPLLEREAVDALRSALLPRADVLTPNLPEAARLLGEAEAPDEDTAARQGRALCALGARATLMKGGHGTGPVCTDLLIHEQGIDRLRAPRLTTRNTHGTGCSLSSAIASELARGQGLRPAVARAHGWLQGAIRAADELGVGHGHGPVHHFHELWT